MHMPCTFYGQKLKYNEVSLGICSYGCDQEALFLLWGHKPCCSSNVCKCIAIRKRLSEKSSQQTGIKRPHTKPSCRKGKTYIEMFGEERAIEMQENISKSLIGKPFAYKSPETEKANSDRARRAIQKRFEDGWQPKAGRCKKIPYNSKIAGDVVLDGSWELVAAKYLDMQNVTWTRNKIRFEFLNLVDKQSWYTPDFFVKEWDTYIEVKGYQTELDTCKWSQFQFNLRIWRKAEIDSFRKIVEECVSG